MNVPQLVKEARQHAGLTQAVLAERAGVSRSTIALVESGARTPSLGMLDGLLAAAGLQTRVELEPLDADVRREMQGLRDRSDVAKDVLDVWGCLHGMDEVAYRVEGVAAASLLGAPVSVPVVSIAFADSDATYAWLAEQIRCAAKVRLDGEERPIDFRLPDESGPAAGPRDGVGDGLTDGALVRAQLREECPDGRFWFETWFDALAARIVPADEVARHVVVATRLGPIAVQPLDEIEATDGDVGRVLRVMREDARPAPGPVPAPVPGPRHVAAVQATGPEVRPW